MAIERTNVQIVRTRPAPNVYTAMLVISTLFVVFGVVYVLLRSQELFGQALPGVMS